MINRWNVFAIRRFSFLLAAGFCLVTGCEQSNGQSSRYRTINSADLQQETGKPIARLFWQDLDIATLKSADVLLSNKTYTLKTRSVVNFPEIDPKKQSLVQMQQVGESILVGVRDQEDGKIGSGWISIRTGVIEQPHGDHSDWTYRDDPEVLHTQIDTTQGNPAHLYVYDKQYYLANDNLNGFTQLDPRELLSQPQQATGRFYPGGGNHITMAAVDHQVCYSSWIDGGGPNMGRVDVVDLSKSGDQAIAYQFHLPTGVIHGAIANSCRIFLAPADGICWLQADTKLEQTAATVQVQHLSLGIDAEEEKPLRTGAFHNHRNWVLLTTGSGETSALGMIDARADIPQVQQLPIPTADGLSLVTPTSFKSMTGKNYAFIFQDRQAGAGGEFLVIVDLDPNGDRNFADAKIQKTLTVAASQVDGHSGHHDLAFDADGRYAYFTNPGDGTIWVLSLIDLEVKAKLQVGGKPGSIIATGAKSHH